MLRVAIISDGKPGHVNQSLGLVAALKRQLPALDGCEFKPFSKAAALATLVLGKQPALAADWQPDLVVGAGHATHLTLLALKRYYRIPAVVFMKPTLPLRWFDLCLIPEHDEPAARDNVIATRGALNRVQPGHKVDGRGLILLGGPAGANSWDDEAMLQHIERIVSQTALQWRLTTSRRTPESMTEKLAQQSGFEFFPAEQTDRDWLPQQLAQAQQCWVSEDSVSMIYEALTAGCAVGTLPVPWTKKGRLKQGIDKLVEQQVITPIERWQGGVLPEPAEPVQEADRCAKALLVRGLVQRS